MQLSFTEHFAQIGDGNAFRDAASFIEDMYLEANFSGIRNHTDRFQAAQSINKALCSSSKLWRTMINPIHYPNPDEPNFFTHLPHAWWSEDEKTKFSQAIAKHQSEDLHVIYVTAATAPILAPGALEHLYEKKAILTQEIHLLDDYFNKHEKDPTSALYGLIELARDSDDPFLRTRFDDDDKIQAADAQKNAFGQAAAVLDDEQIVKAQSMIDYARVTQQSLTIEWLLAVAIVAAKLDLKAVQEHFFADPTPQSQTLIDEHTKNTKRANKDAGLRDLELESDAATLPPIERLQERVKLLDVLTDEARNLEPTRFQLTREQLLATLPDDVRAMMEVLATTRPRVLQTVRLGPFHQTLSSWIAYLDQPRAPLSRRRKP